MMRGIIKSKRFFLCVSREIDCVGLSEEKIITKMMSQIRKKKEKKVNPGRERQTDDETKF